MTDPATYGKYAEECRRLATRAPENDRRLLLEHADVWLKLAEEAERDAVSKTWSSMSTKKGRRFPPWYQATSYARNPLRIETGWRTIRGADDSWRDADEFEPCFRRFL